MVQIWCRNPYNYIAEVVEVGLPRVVWDYGVVLKRRVDPIKHAELFYGQSVPWKVMVIGEQGAAYYEQGDKLTQPSAVYPVWSHGQDWDILEELMANPIGDDPAVTGDKSLDYQSRPVAGQEHMIVINELPNAVTLEGKRFFQSLKDLNEDFPEAKIHIHGSYAYRIMFTMGFASADISPRDTASKGGVMLPSGRSLAKWEQAKRQPQWVLVCNMKPIDLAIPRNRCMFNIKSALWAAENYNELIKFRTRGPSAYVDPNEVKHKSATQQKALIGNPKAQVGDMMSCDACSLSEKCLYYREGAVCGMPQSDAFDLVKAFKSRDSTQIIDGLGYLLSKQASRVTQAMDVEEQFSGGELDKDVSSQLNALINNGIKIAKLIDPTLNKSPIALNINTGGGNAQVIASANPKQLVSSITKELVEMGYPLQDITPTLIQSVLESAANDPGRIGSAVHKAIEGEVIRRD